MFLRSPLKYYRKSFDLTFISGSRAVDDDFLNEEISIVIGLLKWHMYFNGVANNFEYGIGVFFISPHDDHIPRSVHLAFFDNCPTTNNIMMYEACILGLETALKHGIRKIKVIDTLTLHLGKFRVIGILEVWSWAIPCLSGAISLEIWWVKIYTFA